jgi:hypothetical protein
MIKISDVVQVCGVREYPGMICEVDDSAPDFFSVYLRCDEDEWQCEADFDTLEEAVRYAEQLVAELEKGDRP